MLRHSRAVPASNRSTNRKTRRCRIFSGKDRHGSDRLFVFDKARSPRPHQEASQISPALERWRPFLFRAERRETFGRTEENRQQTQTARAGLADRSSRAVLPRRRERYRFVPFQKTRPPANAEYRTR